MRELANSTSAALSKNIKSGRELADELSMITESGNALANRIEAGLTGGAAKMPKSGDVLEEGSTRKDASTTKDPNKDETEPRSETEKELLNMLRNVR